MNLSSATFQPKNNTYANNKNNKNKHKKIKDPAPTQIINKDKIHQGNPYCCKKNKQMQSHETESLK
jgi:hypothetical protein